MCYFEAKLRDLIFSIFDKEGKPENFCVVARESGSVFFKMTHLKKIEKKSEKKSYFDRNIPYFMQQKLKKAFKMQYLSFNAKNSPFS